LSANVYMRYTYGSTPSSYEIMHPYTVDPYEYGDRKMPQMLESLCAEQPVNSMDMRTARDFYIEKESETEHSYRLV
jgi:hypothetical protein